MQKYLFTILLSLCCLLGASSATQACKISQISATNGYYVGSQVTFSTPTAQAYFWTVSGPATIIGSNTNQNLTIEITGPGNIYVNVTRFVNGQCIACSGRTIVGEAIPACTDFQIIQYIPMTYGEDCNCWTKRGHYVLKCGDEDVFADWEISPNGNNGSCIYWGCTIPSSSRQLNSTWIKPHPTCNWVNMQVTIKAYTPGTNNLLASKTVTILPCDAGGPKGFKEGLNIDFDEKQLSFSNESAKAYDLTVIDVLTGKEVTTLKQQHLAKGNYVFNLKDKLIRDKFYLVVVKDQQGKTVISKKIIMTK